MNRFDPPGHLDDLDDAGKEQWSRIVSAWLDEARAGTPEENDGPRAQFFNALADPPASDAQVAVIAWNAFPRQLRSSSLSDKQRWRRADSDRNLQDEYCEWSVARDRATREIVRVTFTCEAPEYWDVLARLAPDKALGIYREHISPSVRHEDLFVGGRYNRRNRFNSTTSDGAMHLIQRSNTLSAEIELGAAATIRRMQDGQEVTDAQALILCSRYGEPGRNSDPFIGEQVNALARRKADITLNNPIGLYLHEFNPVGWATPDGEDPRKFWRYVRGSDGHFLRAVFEVPAARGYGIGGIKIAGRPIEFGAQIADFVTIKLEGLATRLGQSTVAAFTGCRGAAPPPSAILAAAPLDDMTLHARVAARDEPSLEPRATRGTRADRERELLARLPEALRRDLEPAGDDDAAPPALLPYPKLPASHFAPCLVSGRIMAYASPDSTYAVTRKLIDSARRSIVIGLYDFSAAYMKEHLKKAMRRGVALSLMLDTNSADDPNLFADLRRLGANCVSAPSQSAGNPIKFFGNAHEKIIVVDGEIVMIQSGNWSENSIPFNEGDGVATGAFAPGNRDMGMAVHSRELATLFANLVARDMRLAQGEPPEPAPPDTVAAASPASEIFFEAAPPEAPERLFSSLTVVPSTPVRVTPVVTPENFHDTVQGFLRSARHSIRIEQQYIRGGQPAVEALLGAIRAARSASPGLAIRIIVSPKFLFGEKRRQFEKAMADSGLELDDHYRYLSARHFVHCHNKLVVVDGEKALLGSQNWSTTGLVSNREASILVEHAGIAAYFAEIFDADWDVSDSTAAPPDAVEAAVGGLRDAADFARGNVVASTTRDYSGA